LQRSLEFGDRFVETAASGKNDSEIVARLGVSRLACYGREKLIARFRELAALGEDHAEAVASLRVIGPVRKRHAQMRESLVGLRASIEGFREVQMCGRKSGITLASKSKMR